MSEENEIPKRNVYQRTALWLGPAAALAILLFAHLGDNPLTTRMAAVGIWMAIWWIGEATNLAVTALLPMALFPLLGIMKGDKVASLYFNDIIFLFIGGFIIALAMQRWHLHSRIALFIIDRIGLSARRLLLGFMLATAFISMWMSNTATCMMMMPIGLAVILNLEEEIGKTEAVEKLATALVLGIAYSATIGGLGTIIGTPPNMSFVKKFSLYFPDAPPIAFSDWMLFAAPMMILILAGSWWIMCRQYCSDSEKLAASPEAFDKHRAKLGLMKYEEKIVLAVFIVTALLWITRSGMDLGSFAVPGWGKLFEGRADDGTVAITAALLLFLIPAREQGKGCVMNWENTAKLPWGIAILFGGGFALAGGMQDSGLAQYLGEHFNALRGAPPLVLIAGICTGMTGLSEVTSNIAAVEMMLPILAPTAVAIHLNPILLMMPATIAASFGFMLPIATGANTIAFGTGKVTTGQMFRTGLALDLLGIVLATVFMYLWGTVVFHIDFHHMPSWAVMSGAMVSGKP